jgi:hypothetical protein
MEPREHALRVEESPSLPSGDEERFNGYGVMGLTFSSGHVLAMRRFTATSIGPAYRSVWHRDPNGLWTFYADVEPLQSCSRFFGSAIARAVQGPIDISWPGPQRMTVRIDAAALEWECELAPTIATRALNAMARAMPDALWRNGSVLSMMAAIAGPALGAGKLGMHGAVPNGQQFIANPMVVWTIPWSEARIARESFGPVGPLAEQAQLGDFWIPQRGLFAMGRAFFEPFDEVRHLAVASQEAPRKGGALIDLSPT